ncbi:hypothetical protein ASPZODRAFT_132122 [Penicilliopsis zonata CBS 506.65]|uniref:Uncharacterized protein n=1 Tax=Penicilliopsis zonata CBS 506.65 TaxID=1073090 RepID=A0A1L9SIZ6_9EURO|nr:hypothetical protein ASPZODRAFT_132122 [Penicilliopsis zonata CBS 506.65]OJJ47168.1 hypothetical protein ASPZODRAFT_132122 [Penicilliopsis zonata CBS 506.65]
MESWRQRGFVPDSDEEDEFDTQGSLAKTVNGDSVFDGAHPGEEEVEQGDIDNGRDVLRVKNNSAKGSQQLVGETVKEKDIDPLTNGHEHLDGFSEKVAGDEGESTDELMSDPEQDHEEGQGEEEPDIEESQIVSFSRNTEQDTESLSSQLSALPDLARPSTPSAKQAVNFWDIPSSPDELQADITTAQKSTPHVWQEGQRRDDVGIQPRVDDDASSSLSSPPSSLHSIPLVSNQEPNEHEENGAPAEVNDNLESLLPSLDFPQEILAELDQPARRSLRQRNPIQLHPYLLEDAQYQKLMKARGVKPVRLMRYYEEMAKASGESQEQASFDSILPPASSPATDFHPPSSPIIPGDNTIEILHHRRPRGLSPTANLTHSDKRRKLTHHKSGGGDDGPEPSTSNFLVLIDHNRTPGGPQNKSILNVPPSPPCSGSISSTQSTTHSGFRFPKGFTHPTLTTPATEASLRVRNGLVSKIDDSTEPNAVHELTDSDSNPPLDEPHSETESNGDHGQEEIAVRRLQRRIKGVLPASWLRLDLKQQEEKRLSSTQRNRDSTSSHRTENAKGVARKVIKTTTSVVSDDTRRQRVPLLQFSDEEEDDEATHGTNRSISDPKQNNAPLTTLADIVGFDDSFDYDNDGDDDIPEDNRIDYMFPSIPRSATSSRREKHGTKRPRSAKEKTSTERQYKRARLKRQTRLTDSQYGGQKVKRPSRRVPKIGILDAPDVSQKPRNEQPQFLRVAARQARARKDKGRRSPTRKFLKLGSQADTEDANRSLHEWRQGGIRQTIFPKSQPKTISHRRQPLQYSSASEQNINSAFGNDERQRQIIDLSDDHLSPGEKGFAEGASRSAVKPIQPLVRSGGATTAPNQHQRLGNKWIVRRNFGVSSMSRNAPRPAGPDFEDLVGGHRSMPSLFQRSLSLLNQRYRHARASGPHRSSLPLNRFLSESSLPSHSSLGNAQNSSSSESTKQDNAFSKLQRQPKGQRLRKRPPTRIDAHAVDFEQPPPVTFDDSGSISLLSDDVQRSQEGLVSFQRSYTINFNIAPLQTGTFFHESTFLGSGEFSRSLEVTARNMDKEDTALLTIRVGSKSFRWGAWNDSVSTEFGIAFDTVIESIEKTSSGPLEASSEISIIEPWTIYRSIVQYVSHMLVFIDPVDRSSFIETAMFQISKVCNALSDFCSSNENKKDTCMRLACFNLTFANQVYQVAFHDLVDSGMKAQVLTLVKSAAKQLFSIIFSQSSLLEIRKFLDLNRIQENRDSGIRDNAPAVEGFIVAWHILSNVDDLKVCLDNLIAESCLGRAIQDPAKRKDVKFLEDGWHSLYTILPLVEINQLGIARIGSRFNHAWGNWMVVKQLLQPVLSEYTTGSTAQPISYNTYCRVVFQRCFQLINSWGWRDCKLILDTLFDFFATNALYNLRLEESFGSPPFLDDLDRNPPLEVTSGETCFSILLKIIGSGLRFLSNIYDKKRIRNYAWRLLPNHGRVYPKEKELKREDLDALRNHHDLLCTLYWAVPDECRPRLQTIRSLVDPATSHLETLNISIRSWVRLVRFKLSTAEDVSGLEPFADWYGCFVTELIRQHSLARTEVEAQSNTDARFSRQQIDNVISQNQRQIESVLSTSLGGLQNAVKQASNMDYAEVLVSKMPVKLLLSLFNPQTARVNKVVSETLEVISTYVQKDSPLSSNPATTSAAPISTDDDSQEYGDWADIDAMYGNEEPQSSPGLESVEKVFHPAVSRLVSNCFGEDLRPEDDFLLIVVDCWTSVAHALAKHSLRHWDSYLSPYDGDSWTTLRSTVQTRKFTSQFLASCIEKDTQFLSECKMQIFGMWMSSLVERSLMLKFQHRLTEALLNRDPGDPLLRNLPFSKDRSTNVYSITLEEFSQRRLSLISSILSNMREHLRDLEESGSRNHSSTRMEYKELLGRMMSSMKANYQELGNGTDIAQGAYVDFVHSIIGFLQQHTRDIGPIDPFFTDPTSFPLPLTDPTYIVAKLKSYEPKLLTEKVVKTLVIFIQGVSERAAIDGQQRYLVNQLCASMSGTYEGGNLKKPTLRAFLLQCLFPPYLEAIFTNPAAWILGRPILETMSLVFKDLLLDVDSTDHNCVSSVMSIFDTVFHSTSQALRQIIDNPDMLKEPTVLLTLVAFVETMTSALPVVDYIDRATEAGENIILKIQACYQFARWSVSRLRDPSLVFGGGSLEKPLSPSSSSAVPPFFQQTRSVATRELQAYINESWSRFREKYYFTRRGAHQPQEVSLDPDIAANLETSAEPMLEKAVESLSGVWEALELGDN